MLTTLRRIGGSVGAATLAVHLVAGPVAAQAAPAADCRAAPLPLPADAPPTAPTSSATGDETGLDVIGHVHANIGRRRPVLWTDGVPRWIAPQQAVALDVASDGTVVGMLQGPDGKRPWRATVSGGYEPLALPDGVVAPGRTASTTAATSSARAPTRTAARSPSPGR